MKNSIKMVSILLTIATMAFTSCKKDDCHEDPKPDPKDCNTELIFMDHASCSGDWFKTTSGEYLEVYGYPNASKLTKGDRVRFGYSDFDNSNMIECAAIGPFEMWLGENGHSYRTVKANKACFKDETEKPEGCDNELECVDLGLCQGVWFKDKQGNYLRVHGYPDRNSLKVGDIVKFGYNDYTHSGNVCLGMTQWEVSFLESKQPYKVVEARKECFNNSGTGCSTKVTYVKRDICSGELMRTDDGKLLRVFDLTLMNINLVEGNRYTINYVPTVLQNDCMVVRDPSEMGKPVKATCFNGNNIKE